MSLSQADDIYRDSLFFWPSEVLMRTYIQKAPTLKECILFTGTHDDQHNIVHMNLLSEYSALFLSVNIFSVLHSMVFSNLLRIDPTLDSQASREFLQ